MSGWEALSTRAARPHGSEDAAPAASSAVTLGPRDRLIGQLYIEGDLTVSGTLEGEVEATGNVDVAEGASVKASVSGREVGISGQVNGAVTASKKLVVSRSGSLTGDVRVPRLVIQDGATFSGNVSMTGSAPVAKPEPAAEAPVVAVEVPVPASNGPAPEKSKGKRR